MQQHTMQRLSDSVTEFLRSTVVITGLSAAAEELIVNSLDAGAQHVHVSIDFPHFALQVSDDGQGIPFHLLQGLLGTRYVSSKGLPHEQLSGSGQAAYGCRGEALSSLGCIADVDIMTRFAGSPATFHKRIRFGECMQVEKCGNKFEHGTVVTVNRLFENVPVRQRTCQVRAEQTKLRDFVRRLAVLHHTVSFTLVDAATRKVLVATKPQVSVAASFMALYGPQTLTKMQEAATEHDGYTLAGLISPPFHETCTWSKDTQLLYINNRWMRNTDTIGQFINQVYLATLRTKDVTTTRHHGGEEKGVYPCYILHFTCPVEDVDILCEPDKSTAVFRRPEVVEACVKQLVQAVFERYRPDKAAMIARMCTMGRVDPEMFEAVVVDEDADGEQMATQEPQPVSAASSSSSSHEQYVVRAASPVSQGVAYQQAFFSSPEDQPQQLQHASSTRNLGEVADAAVQLVPEFGVMVSRPVHEVEPSWAVADDDDGVGMFSQYSYSYAPPSQAQTGTRQPPAEPEYTDGGVDIDLGDRNELSPTAVNEVQHSILAEALASPPLSQPACSSPTAEQQTEEQNEQQSDARAAASAEKKENDAEQPQTQASTATPRDFTCPYPREPIGAQTLQLPVNLDKRLLDDCITVGQSDRKYILVVSGDQLLAIDQHAADERLRLERFEARLDVNTGAGSVMKSIELHPPHVTQVAETTIDLLEQAAEIFFHWNFKYELDRDACAVSLLEVPLVTGEVLTANDFLEYVDYVSTRTSFPVSMLRPPAVTRILASRACRGAIMFGERLELDRCSQIIDGLRACNFPFQCAHGRPSIVPLFDIASAHRAKSSRKRKADSATRFRRRHPF